MEVNNIIHVHFIIINLNEEDKMKKGKNSCSLLTPFFFGQGVVIFLLFLT